MGAGTVKKRPGRRAKDRTDYLLVERVAPKSICAKCGHPRPISQRRRSPVQTLGGDHFWLVWKDRGCRTEGCCCRELVRPLEGHELHVPRHEFGLDVVFYVGESRREGKSFPMIHKELNDDHGVRICESHVPDLFRLYLALVECRTLQSETVMTRLREQGRLILSGDAVKFDSVSPAIYVIRDVLSQEILGAMRFQKATKQAIIEMLKPIREAGIPVEATLSDKEPALLEAFEAVFPEAKHQICQTHFLMNVVKPMESELRTVQTQVREVVKKVRDIELKLDSAKASPKEKELAKVVCRAVGAMGKSKAGDKLFEPASLKRYLRLDKVREDLRATLKKKKGSWPLLERILACLTILTGCALLANRLEKQFEIVRGIAEIFDAGRSKGRTVTKRLQRYLKKLEQGAPKRGRGAPYGHFIRHVVAVSGRFWKGLFHCYDVPGLPRTNNGLEQFFNALKNYLRRIHGRKSTAGGPIESLGPLILKLWNRMEEYKIEDLFEGLDPAKLKEAKERLREAEKPARERRSILRDPNRHLDPAYGNFLIDG